MKWEGKTGGRYEGKKKEEKKWMRGKKKGNKRTRGEGRKKSNEKIMRKIKK